jgi:hypothetical protein
MRDRHLRLVQPNQQQGQQNEMFNDMLRGYATMLLAAGRDRGSVGKLLQMLRGVRRVGRCVAVGVDFPGRR